MTKKDKDNKERHRQLKTLEERQSRLYERMNGETIYHTNKDKDIIT